MGEDTRCPCCGAFVQVISDHEGTQSYRPLAPDAEVARLRQKVVALEQEVETLRGDHDALVRQLRELAECAVCDQCGRALAMDADCWGCEADRLLRFIAAQELMPEYERWRG
ncbi:MAG: hypothetical protein ACREOH_10575 [Candidatus Entotheonellia bacterium]